VSLPELPGGFKLERLLGRSPLSEVYLVRSPSGIRMALKLLRPSAARDPRLKVRVERESQLLEDLDHPNLVKGFGMLEVEGRLGLLLEFIDGPTLRDQVQAGALGWEQAARYGIQLARALDRLHRHGALHRDVKPHNVLIHSERGAILADLGLVRRSEDPELTRQGAALGSPAYMSPEQARDPSGVGPEADVYSLGATLHHAVSGQPPFLGKGVGEVIHRVLHLEPEPLPKQVPEPLQRVLAVALAKDIDRRYSRARDFSQDLGRVLLGHPPRLLTAHRRRKRMRTAVAALATPVLLLASVLAYQAWWPTSELIPQEQLESQGEGDEQTSEQDGESRTPSLGFSDQRVLYDGWAEESLRRASRAYEEGAYRVAWQSVELFATRPFPDFADANFFEQLRRAEVQRRRNRLEQRAAEVFVDVAEVLQAAADGGRRQIQAGEFNLEDWREFASSELQRRVPRATQLPLYSGGDSPTELLESHALTLERQNRESWRSRARNLLPDLRPRLARALQDGELESAWALWSQTDGRLLEYSLEARREGWRMEQLVAADRALASELASRLGQEWTIRLREGEVQGRVTLPQEGGTHWRLQVDDGRRVSVRFLDLDPDAIDRVVLLRAAEQDWLRGQLLWAQGRTGEAIDLMRRLALRAWPAEADPYFWVGEWERERALQTGLDQALTEVRHPTDASDAGASAAQNPQPGDPLEELARELRAQLIGATVAVEDDRIVLSWQGLDWHPSWVRSWPFDRRRWQITAWQLTWQLPLGEKAPERVRLWTDIRCEQRGDAWRLDVAGKVTDGVVFVPGATQTLAWDGERVRFDGFDVGAWQPEGGRRILLRGEASSRFVPQRMELRLAPVPR